MTLLNSLQVLQLLGRRLWIKAGSKRVDREQAVCFEIDNKLVSEVQRLGISKAGNIAYVGKLGNQRVKICQTFSAAHARFIQRVCERSELQEYFPRVLHRKDQYIIVEWIDGKPLTAVSLIAKPQLLERLVRIQVALHTQLHDEEPGFDYVQFLEKRLHQFRAILPLSDSLKQILEKVHSATPSAISRLSHPDVTPNNIVIQKSSGKLKLVDNELLTQSPCYLIDLFNTYYTLRHLRQPAMQYVALYGQYAPNLQLLEDWDSYLLGLWGLRLIGTRFQAGKLAQAYRLASQIAAGEFDDHPIIRMIQEEISK
jgi:thiamine kinase-like enzyme